MAQKNRRRYRARHRKPQRDEVRKLLDAFPHLHWLEAVALVNKRHLYRACLTEAQAIPACKHPDLIAAVMQLSVQIATLAAQDKRGNA